MNSSPALSSRFSIAVCLSLFMAFAATVPVFAGDILRGGAPLGNARPPVPPPAPKPSTRQRRKPVATHAILWREPPAPSWKRAISKLPLVPPHRLERPITSG